MKESFRRIRHKGRVGFEIGDDSTHDSARRVDLANRFKVSQFRAGMRPAVNGDAAAFAGHFPIIVRDNLFGILDGQTHNSGQTEKKRWPKSRWHLVSLPYFHSLAHRFVNPDVRPHHQGKLTTEPIL